MKTADYPWVGLAVRGYFPVIIAFLLLLVDTPNLMQQGVKELSSMG
ncbi:hypothetical protein Holit_01828 [Hollandina sp. SP2]